MKEKCRQFWESRQAMLLWGYVCSGMASFSLAPGNPIEGEWRWTALFGLLCVTFFIAAQRVHPTTQKPLGFEAVTLPFPIIMLGASGATLERFGLFFRVMGILILLYNIQRIYRYPRRTDA